MCYSAQVRAEHKKFQRVTASKMPIKEYVRLYWLDEDELATWMALAAVIVKLPGVLDYQLQASAPGVYGRSGLIA